SASPVLLPGDGASRAPGTADRGRAWLRATSEAVRSRPPGAGADAAGGAGPADRDRGRAGLERSLSVLRARLRGRAVRGAGAARTPALFLRQRRDRGLDRSLDGGGARRSSRRSRRARLAGAAGA